jgi:hypothetical protein
MLLLAISLLSVSLLTADCRLMALMGVKPYKSGVNTINCDGRDNSYNPVSSGIYFIRINTGTESHTQKMLMMK